jgi:hypothetical protein
MKTRLRSLVLALLGALVWSGGCLNPRPEDFPSADGLQGPGSGAAGEGDGNMMGQPGLGESPSNDLGDDDPDSSEVPIDVPVTDPPDPSFDADAGVRGDAGAPDSGSVVDVD